MKDGPEREAAAGQGVERRLRIGIDGRPLQGNRTGVGRYLAEICKELDQLIPEASFYLYTTMPVTSPVASRRWIVRPEPSKLWRRVRQSVWLKARCGKLAREDGVQLFWGSTGLLAGPLRGIPTLLTVHDLNFRVAPETMANTLLLSHRLFVPRDVARADLVAAVSQGTSQRLQELLGRPADFIARPAVGDQFRPVPKQEVRERLGKYGLHKPYLLSVATWEPRKNLELLIRTYLSMRRDGLLLEHQLVLVGGRGWKDERLRSLVAGYASGAEETGVVPLGYVPDEDLVALYSGSAVFAFPSGYEGFGIPVAEALACGARVVATDIPELREAGGEDAIYVAATEEGLRKGLLAALDAPEPTPPETYRGATWRASAAAYAQHMRALGQ